MQYPSLAADSLVDILRLIRTSNVGPITFFQLMLRYSRASEALEALPGLSIRGGKKQAIKPYSKSQAEEEIERTHAFGARFIRYGEADYPSLLTYASDAPPLLVVKGDIHSYKDQPLLAMVGSRNATANSCQLAQKLAREVSNAGIRVVSGLARGIDTFAHKGALATGTIAVIAGGIDNIYPPENMALYTEIPEKGCVITEQPFGQAPFAGAFPSRNRIIAGMSHGTLIVEASPKSGSLITARMALDYNRELMAIPGSPVDPRAKGCNQLLKDGAHLVEEAADIIALIQQGRQSVKFAETGASFSGGAPIDESEIARAHAILKEKLSPVAVSIDEIAEQSFISIATLQAALLELELAGNVRRVPGNKVVLAFTDEQSVA